MSTDGPPPLRETELLPRSRARLRSGLYRADRSRLREAVEEYLTEAKRLQRAWLERGWSNELFTELVLGDQLDLIARRLNDEKEMP